MRAIRIILFAALLAGAAGACSSAKGSEAFCDRVKASLASDQDPRAALEALRSAPPEIADEAAALVDVIEQMASLEDEDDAAAFAALIAMTQDDEFLADMDKVRIYVMDECGVDIPEPTIDMPQLPSPPEPMTVPELPEIAPPPSAPPVPTPPEVPTVPAAPSAPEPVQP